MPVPKKSAITSLNDYHPVPLTLVIMKCLERIVLKYINDVIPVGLDSHQFAYKENQSAEDGVSLALHTALSHLEHPNTSGCYFLTYKNRQAVTEASHLGAGYTTVHHPL